MQNIRIVSPSSPISFGRSEIFRRRRRSFNFPLAMGLSLIWVYFLPSALVLRS